MSEECKCIYEEDIIKLKLDVGIQKNSVNNVNEDVREIKGKIDKFSWWLLGILTTCVVTLLTILLKGG